MAIIDPAQPAPKGRKRKAAQKSSNGGKRGRKPKVAVASEPPVQSIQLPDEDVGLNVVIDDGSYQEPRIDPATGAMEIPHDDGSILVDFSPEVNPDIDAKKHDANLALKLGMFELNNIAEDLLEGIATDEDSRSEWMEMRARGVDMLGLKVEQAKSGVGASTAPLEGMSVVRDPVMLEAVLRFQANAQGELLPAAGPVKTVTYGDSDTISDTLAEALEKDLNFYLTTTATEYYPDSRRMYFWTGFSGLAFKKVYRCPLRRRPVSESVDATDLIVSDTITDLRNAQRITHQISMRHSTMKRMQILGVYRDCDLTQPQPTPNAGLAFRLCCSCQAINLSLERFNSIFIGTLAVALGFRFFITGFACIRFFDFRLQFDFRIGVFQKV